MLSHELVSISGFRVTGAHGRLDQRQIDPRVVVRNTDCGDVRPMVPFRNATSMDEHVVDEKSSALTVDEFTGDRQVW